MSNDNKEKLKQQPSEAQQATTASAANIIYKGAVTTKVQRGNTIYNASRRHNLGRQPLFDLLLATLQGVDPKGAPNALCIYTRGPDLPTHPSELAWDTLSTNGQLESISNLLLPVSEPYRAENDVIFEFKIPYQSLTRQAPIYALALFSRTAGTTAPEAALAYYLYANENDEWQPLDLLGTAATASQYNLLIEWAMNISNPT